LPRPREVRMHTGKNQLVLPRVFLQCVNVHTTDATTGATAMLLPAMCVRFVPSRLLRDFDLRPLRECWSPCSHFTCCPFSARSPCGHRIRLRTLEISRLPESVLGERFLHGLLPLRLRRPQNRLQSPLPCLCRKPPRVRTLY
jgi:hypothetical protein